MADGLGVRHHSRHEASLPTRLAIHDLRHKPRLCLAECELPSVWSCPCHASIVLPRSVWLAACRNMALSAFVAMSCKMWPAFDVSARGNRLEQDL